MQKHIVAFSGGAASAVVAKVVVDEVGVENTTLLFHDTKAEHPDSYRFRQQVSAFLGVPITEVSDGRDLWQVIDDNHSLPSDRMPFCSRFLKLEPGNAYINALLSEGHSVTVYKGYGVNEWHRYQNGAAWAERGGYRLVCPLIDRMITDPKAIVRSWGICLPVTYQYLTHNNCLPCFRSKRFAHWKAIYEHHRDIYERCIALEDQYGHTVLPGMTLRQLALKFESSAQLPELHGYNELPCECAL